MNISRLIAIYLLSLLSASGIYSYCEDKTFFEGFYWASVTSTTIGYGDYLPTKTVTKVTMIIFAHFQVMVCIPLIIAQLMSKTIKNLDLYSHAEQEWTEAAIEKIAEKLHIELPPAPDGEND